MDTREKIVGADAAREAAARPGTAVVAGYFDPLLASHAVRLAEIRRGSNHLVVIVLDPPSPALPRRARAELVAALASVDLVVMDDAGLDPTHHEEDSDLLRRDDLIRRVAIRSQAVAK